MSDAPKDGGQGAETPKTENAPTPNAAPEQPEGAAEQSAGPSFFRRRASLQSAAQQLQPDHPPPGPPPRASKRRDGALSALSGVLSFLLLLAVASAFGLISVLHKLQEPGGLASEKIVYIAPRSDVPEILAQLEREGVIDSPTLMNIALVIEGARSKLKPGEYLFKQGASLREVMDELVSGRQVMHAVTIPEGLTSEQVVLRLRENDVLAGDVLDIPKEGALLPETYKVVRYFPRSKLLAKMQEDQRKLLDQIWTRRSKDLPVKTPFELLTLASIVEKETGRAEERPHVASVFVNRLRKGMRLQSDPTIVYGLVGGKGSLGRGILRSEVERATPYNTYAINGLPPGPIANPGRAALEAVANPLRTQDLYFVADGTGGHVFAETLEQHSRNVQRWRQIEQEQKDNGVSDVDHVSPAVPPPSPQPGQGKRSDADGVSFGRLAAIDGRQDDYPPGGAMAGEDGPTHRIGRMAYVDLASTLGALEDPSAANAMAAIELRRARAFFTFASSQIQKRSGIDPLAMAKEAAAQAEASGADDGEQTASTEGESYVDRTAAYGDGSEPESYPVSARRRAEQKARAARLGLASGTDDPPVDVVGDRLTQEASAAPPMARGRSRAFDASEGTAIDPLREKSWDLNSAKNVPSSTSLR
jgi:UPF0755 protein